MISEEQKCSSTNLSQQQPPAAAKASHLLGWTGKGIAGRTGNEILTLFCGVHEPGAILVPPVPKTLWKIGEDAVDGYDGANKLENPI